jgi:hypothetical protein
VSYSDTYDSLCVLLEEYADADIETVANQILAMFGLLGEDLLDALDPPMGLSTWLRQHGLSLMVTAESRSPRVWEALEEEDEEDEEGNLEGEGETVPLQVGEFIEYRTAPQGPNHVCQVGAGRITEINEDHIWVTVTGLPRDVYLEPETDFIRPVPGPDDPRNAEAPPS